MLSCIKPGCANTYEGQPDDYCLSCREANKTLAKKIDAQMANRPKREAVSTIQQLEAHGQVPMGNGTRMFSRKINYGN